VHIGALRGVGKRRLGWAAFGRLRTHEPSSASPVYRYRADVVLALLEC
jgi:hypothetical protein